MVAVQLTPNQQLTAVTSLGFNSLWNLFSGFLISNAKMPNWICPVAWMLYGIISTQLGGVDTPFHIAGFGAQIMVKDFITSYLGYHYDWLICVVAVCISFVGIFGSHLRMQSSS